MEKNTIFGREMMENFEKERRLYAVELTKEEMMFKSSLNVLNCSFIDGQAQNIALGSGIARASSLALALENLPNLMRDGIVDADVANRVITEGLVKSCREHVAEFRFCRTEDLVNSFMSKQNTSVMPEIFPTIDNIVIVDRPSNEVAYELLCGGYSFAIPENVEVLARAIPHISRWSSESCIDIQNLVSKGLFKTIDNGLKLAIAADARATVKFSIADESIEVEKKIKGQDNSLVVNTPLGSVANKVTDFVCDKDNKVNLILNKLEDVEVNKVNHVLIDMIERNENNEKAVISSILEMSQVEKEISKLLAANLSGKLDELEKEDKDIFFQSRKDMSIATKNCILSRTETIDPAMLGKLVSISPCYHIVQDSLAFSTNNKFRTHCTKSLDDFVQYAITGDKKYFIPVSIVEGCPAANVGFLVRGIDYASNVVTDSIYTGNCIYDGKKANFEKIIDINIDVESTLIDMIDLSDIETVEQIVSIDRLLDLGLIKSYTANGEVQFELNINGYGLEKEAREIAQAIISELFSNITPLEVGDVIDNPYADGEVEIVSVSQIQNVCYVYTFEQI